MDQFLTNSSFHAKQMATEYHALLDASLEIVKIPDLLTVPLI